MRKTNPVIHKNRKNSSVIRTYTVRKTDSLIPHITNKIKPYTPTCAKHVLLFSSKPRTEV